MPFSVSIGPVQKLNGSDVGVEHSPFWSAELNVIARLDFEVGAAWNYRENATTPRNIEDILHCE